MKLNNLYHIDAWSGLDELQSDSVDLILSNVAHTDMSTLGNLLKVLKPTGYLVFVLENWNNISGLTSKLVNTGFNVSDNVLTWVHGEKTSPIMLAKKYHSDIPLSTLWDKAGELHFRRPEHMATPHLEKYLIGEFCPKGGLVVDPFVGSGYVVYACILMGRDYIGFELEHERFTKTRNLIDKWNRRNSTLNKWL